MKAKLKVCEHFASSKCKFASASDFLFSGINLVSRLTLSEEIRMNTKQQFHAELVLIC